MKNFLLLIALITAGCAFQHPYEIAQPSGPSVVIVAPPAPVAVQSEKPVVMPPSQGQAVPSQVKIWRPESNNILICNLSKTITVDKLWIDSRPPNPPTFQDLSPEVCQPIVIFFGDHYWYAEGSVELQAYGRVSVGTARRDFSIRNWSSWWGGYAQRLNIYEGDFNR